MHKKKKKNKNKNGKSEDIGKTKIKQSKTTQWNMGAFCRELLELRKDQCLGKRTNRRENATTTALQLVLPFGTLERCTNRIVKLYSLSFFFYTCLFFFCLFGKVFGNNNGLYKVKGVLYFFLSFV
jgi:hypothetical protein